MSLHEHSPGNRSRALHCAAIVTACLTFPLIFLGGLVTSKHAGMSVPDWPNSYGYNMFLYPPKLWIGGIFYEHTHRLLGSLVGLCAVVMTLIAWGPGGSGRGRRLLRWAFGVASAVNVLGTAAMIVRPDLFHLPTASRSVGNIASQGIVGEIAIGLCVLAGWFCRSPEPRRGVRWIATACLIAIVCQGILGGLRVDLVNLGLAIVHGCFAQATFCLLILAVTISGSWWQRVAMPGRPDRGLIRLAIFAVLIVYCQLILGALMRHFGAGLAVPGVLFYGHWLPPTSAGALAAINHDRVWRTGLDPVSLGQIWLHVGHRVGALCVTAVLLLLAKTIFTRHRDEPALVRPALAVLVLLVTQISLGVWTVYRSKPADIASLHVAVGASVLATTFLIAVRSVRLYSMSATPLPSRIETAPQWPVAAEFAR